MAATLAAVLAVAACAVAPQTRTSTNSSDPACVANQAWTVVMTSQFICTNHDIATGRVFWFTPSAPRQRGHHAA